MSSIRSLKISNKDQKTFYLGGGDTGGEFQSHHHGLSPGGKDTDASISINTWAWTCPETHHPSIDVPGPRAAHSTNVIGNKMYVFGGWNGRAGLANLCVLDVDTLEWSVVPTTSTTPSSRNNHASFVHNSKLYIHGGHDGKQWLADLHYFDTNTLQRGLEGAWKVSSAGGAGAVGTRLGLSGLTHDTTSFDGSGSSFGSLGSSTSNQVGEWAQPIVSGDRPSPRACHTMSVIGAKAYMVGGYDGDRCFNDVDVLDLDTMTWIRPSVQGTLPQPRNAQTVTVVGRKLILFGGHSGNRHLSDLHIFDTKTYRWSQPDVKGLSPPGLRGHTANLLGSRIFLFGGYDGRGRSNDLYLLDTETFKWEHPGSNDSTPSGRQRHTASLVHNKHLFILGGFDGTKWLSDLHVLDVSKIEESEIVSLSVTHLLRDIASLVNNPDSFPDVKFLVEGRELYAHKSILCARSTHFRTVFSHEWAERSAGMIEFKDWSYAAFLATLTFLYTGRCPSLNPDVAVDVLGLSDHLGLEGLRNLCSSNLMQSIESSSVCSLISYAHRFGATELKAACMEFLLKNHYEVDLSSLKGEPELMLEVLQLSFRTKSKGS